jgi:hypothetical protein
MQWDLPGRVEVALAVWLVVVWSPGVALVVVSAFGSASMLAESELPLARV